MVQAWACQQGTPVRQTSHSEQFPWGQISVPEHCNTCLHPIYPGLVVVHVQVAPGGWQAQPEPHILAGHAFKPKARVAELSILSVIVWQGE